MSDTPVLSVRDLRIGYDGKTVLEKIDFDVARGEVFVILGGSGCGKSTLLRTMIGLIKPLAGSVKVDGEEFLGVGGAARVAMLRKFGVLYQSSALFSSMTLVENVSLGLAMCAERVALFATVAAGERPTTLVVASPRTNRALTFPCGACLQVGLELGGRELVVVAVDPDGASERAVLGDLLPRGPHKG